jgi:hypothetical protein
MGNGNQKSGKIIIKIAVKARGLVELISVGIGTLDRCPTNRHIINQ